jgi:DNA-binding transcriptional LysR family regulator
LGARADTGGRARRIIRRRAILAERQTARTRSTYAGTLIGLVKVGLGVAIVPAHATVLVDRTSVRWKCLERPTIEREVLMVHRAGLSLSPAVQAFAEYLPKNNPHRAVPLASRGRVDRRAMD